MVNYMCSALPPHFLFLSLTLYRGFPLTFTELLNYFITFVSCIGVWTQTTKHGRLQGDTLNSTKATKAAFAVGEEGRASSGSFYKEQY